MWVTSSPGLLKDYLSTHNSSSWNVHLSGELPFKKIFFIYLAVLWVFSLHCCMWTLSYWHLVPWAEVQTWAPLRWAQILSHWILGKSWWLLFKSWFFIFREGTQVFPAWQVCISANATSDTAGSWVLLYKQEPVLCVGSWMIGGRLFWIKGERAVSSRDARNRKNSQGLFHNNRPVRFCPVSFSKEIGGIGFHVSRHLTTVTGRCGIEKEKWDGWYHELGWNTKDWKKHRMYLKQHSHS